MRTAELQAQHNKLLWYIALPILSADLYSSVAYGPEAGITELASFGNAAKWYIIPITISTVVLLAILITSYIMGVLAYPNGGGAYAIAKDNYKQRWVSLIASSLFTCRLYLNSGCFYIFRRTDYGFRLSNYNPL